jgi:hypothetical protein
MDLAEYRFVGLSFLVDRSVKSESFPFIDGGYLLGQSHTKSLLTMILCCIGRTYAQRPENRTSFLMYFHITCRFHFAHETRSGRKINRLNDFREEKVGVSVVFPRTNLTKTFGFWQQFRDLNGNPFGEFRTLDQEPQRIV